MGSLIWRTGNMVTVFLICFSAVLLIVPLFSLLTYISKRRNQLTGPKMATIMERHIQGTDDPADLDYFTAIPIADKRLDDIRRRCIELDTPSALLPEELDEFKQLIKELKN